MDRFPPPMTPDPDARRYTAFLSYRHADNKEEGRRWAEWLHQGIETYEVPADLVGKPNLRGEPIPASLYPVFRDEEELPADADLSDNIRRALRNSASLVVLCSPRACDSRFVADEIRTFKELGKSPRILALMLDGEPNASDDPAKEMLGQAECLPQPLRFGVQGDDGVVDWSQRCEPIAADVRPEGRPEQGYTSSAAYRQALERAGTNSRDARRSAAAFEERLQLARLKIIAGLLNVPLGQLRDRDAAFRVKKARRRQIIASTVAVLALLLTAFALWQRHVAEDQRRQTEEKKKEVQNLADDQQRLLGSASLAALHQADRLLAEADEANPYTGEADSLIRTRRQEALAHLARAVRFNPSSTIARERFAREAIFSRHYFYGVPETRFPIPLATGEEYAAFKIFLDGAKGRAFTAAPDGVQVWDVTTQKMLFKVPQTGRLIHAGINAAGNRLLTAGQVRFAYLWDAANGQSVSALEHERPLRHARFSAEGHHALTIDDGDTLKVWDAATGKLLGTRDEDLQVSAAISPDGTRVAILFDQHGKIWDTRSDRIIAEWDDGESGGLANIVDGDALQFAGDGKYFAIVRRKVVEIRDGMTGGIDQKLGDESHKAMFRKTAFGLDGRYFLAGYSDGGIRLWDLETGAERRLRSHSQGVLDVAFSPDGKRFASTALDQTVAVGVFTPSGPMTVVTAQDVGPVVKVDFLRGSDRFSPT
jgi:hypothetical protein